MHRPRPRTIAAGALVLLLGAAPFIPRGGGDHGAISPSGDRPRFAPREATAVGYGEVTPTMKQEIDRVVAMAAAAPRITGRISPRAATALVQCADFEGQRYCLGQGWTEDSPAVVRARVAAAAAPGPARRTAQHLRRTGGLSAADLLRRYARMTPRERAAADRAELIQAARSVAKVWMIRHEIQGVPLPAGFLAAHPEARTTVVAARAGTGTYTTASDTTYTSPTARPSGATSETTTATTSSTGTGGTTNAVATSPSPSPSPSVSSPPPAPAVAVTYPAKAKVLKRSQTAEQIRNYWCGPTSMQMIAWGWKQVDKGAAHWAAKLHTTTHGTAMSDMVRVTNNNTGWDKLAGPYIVLDVNNFTTAQFWTLLQKHIAQYKAPIILNPLLLTRYFPYLARSGGGHFQVGRGYRTSATYGREIGYFEPWNQQRFHPSEPYISRVQWLPVGLELAAIKADFHQIGL